MSRLRVYETHGVIFSGESGDEQIGICPFTGKADKFYVNTKTMLWDSKTYGMGGNIAKFLHEIHKQYAESLTKPILARLAENRKLPLAAFVEEGLGWDGKHFTIPVRDAGGAMQDIRMFKLGGRVISTAGCNTGLYGAELLGDKPNDPIYLCEGEWDTIAVRWLLDSLDLPGVVVGVPGAGVFKNEWRDWFQGRRVHTTFDADEPGEGGEILVQKRLAGVAQSLTFTHWPTVVPTGFDVRDWIVYGAVERGTPTECWEKLEKLFDYSPRKGSVGPTDATRRAADRDPVGAPDRRGILPGRKDRPSLWTKTAPTFTDVVGTFKKWLFLDRTDAIELMLATAVSQQIDGPPVWLFLVGPPGSAKTETLASLAKVPEVYMTSSLTPHALISGATWKGDQDPSLIPRLNGKIMVIKDFTSILAMRDAEKDEIFGILRDAYDGKCGKVFGTGIERNYESRFTIMAAVTPSIYGLSSQHQALGERFLKVTVGDNLNHRSEEDIIQRAMDNVDRDSEMKWELQDVVHSYLTRRVKPNVLPILPAEVSRKLIALAMFTARLRGTVSRDTYRSDIITSRPSAEIGTRLAVQLSKLAKSIAIVHGRPHVVHTDYSLIRKVALDTVSQRTEDLVRHLLKRCPTVDDTLSTQELALYTRYPIATVSRILQDLDILDVVTRVGTTYRYRWSLSPYIRKCIATAELYRVEDEINRPTRRWVKMIKRKKKEA